MQRTDNFNLIVVEGSDTVNLLTQMNPNTEVIDEQMFKNQNAGVQTATELLNGTVHAITRSIPDASMIRFTAVSRFTTGDTFTVDGVQVSALLPSGEQLPDGAFIIGSEVLCTLKGTLLTFYTNGGTVATARNAERLGNELPEYYATKSEVDSAQTTADSAGALAESNRVKINKILNNFNVAGGIELIRETDNIAPFDGIVHVGGFTGQLQWGAFGVSVNGLTVFSAQAGLANNNIYNVYSIKVNKGDVVKVSASGGGGITMAYIYPYA